MTQFAVKGLPELKAKFSLVSAEVGKNSLRKGVSAGAKVVKAAVKSAAPLRKQIVGRRGSKPGRAPGTLKAAVIIKYVREQSGPDQALMIVTVRQGRAGSKSKLVASKDAYYGKFVERGHRIVTRRGKSVRKAQRTSGGIVPPHPFMAPAFARSKDQAVSAMVSVMAEELKKIVQQ